MFWGAVPERQIPNLAYYYYILRWVGYLGFPEKSEHSGARARARARARPEYRTLCGIPAPVLGGRSGTPNTQPSVVLGLSTERENIQTRQ